MMFIYFRKSYSRAVSVMRRLNLGAAKLMHKYKAHAATSIGGFGVLGHAMALARCQKDEVSFVIHNLPVIAKMASVAKARGQMFPLTQVYHMFVVQLVLLLMIHL